MIELIRKSYNSNKHSSLTVFRITETENNNEKISDFKTKVVTDIVTVVKKCNMGSSSNRG